MTSFAGAEIIDLTTLDDSEEDLPTKPKSLVKKRHTEQFSSSHRLHATGNSNQRSYDESAPSRHRTSSTSLPTYRARPSGDGRKVDKALRAEDVTVQRKVSGMPGKGSKLADRQTTQEQRDVPVKDSLRAAKHGGISNTPSGSPPASRKDRSKTSTPKQPHRVSLKAIKAGDVQSFKAPEPTDHTKSSPIQASIPKVLPNGCIKTEDLVSRAQPASVVFDASTQVTSFTETTDSQTSSLPADHLAVNGTADGINGRAVSHLTKPPVTASTLLHQTTLKGQRAQHADVLLYLDRIGIEWHYRDDAVKSVIVLAKHLAAIRSGLLGDVPNEAFSLNVNGQGELIITRKAEAIVVSNTSSALDKKPSSIIQERDRRLVPFREALSKASKASKASDTATQRVLAWLPNAESITTINNPKAVSEAPSKRKLTFKNKKLQAKSFTREALTDGENDDADGCLLSGSDSDDLTYRAKRRRLNLASDRHDCNVNEFELGDVIDKDRVIPVYAAYSSAYFGKAKTRIPNYPLYSRGCLLRNRELASVGCLDMQQSFTRLRESCLDTMLQPWRDWTGASKDVICAEWAPDGMSFVIGSSTDLDERSLQYNRSNNLMWCDMLTNTIMELENHKIQRPALPPDASDLSRVLDPYVFTTISDIAYGQYSTRFWTASYDKTVKIWDIERQGPNCIRTIKYSNLIDILVPFDACPAEAVTTAQRSSTRAVEIYQYKANSSVCIPDPNHAEKYNLVPTALAWGHPIAGTKAVLAAGYGDKDNEALRSSRGDIVLWNAEVQAELTHLRSRYHYVFDLTWHTHLPWLAAAIPAKETIHAGLDGTQSNIRIWQPQTLERYIYDLDCLALDINRVIFNPMDFVSVSAACTDGSVYHYDLRQPTKILAKFEHGPSITQLDPNRSRESQDFGVQFISWNTAGTLLYSGSSDGKVKQWNPLLNNEDAFIEDIATLDAEISSGSFSPDFTNLLIGTAKGSAHVFSSAPVTPWADEDEDQARVENGQGGMSGSFKFCPAKKVQATR